MFLLGSIQEHQNRSMMHRSSRLRLMERTILPCQAIVPVQRPRPSQQESLPKHVSTGTGKRSYYPAIYSTYETRHGTQQITSKMSPIIQMSSLIWSSKFSGNINPHARPSLFPFSPSSRPPFSCPSPRRLFPLLLVFQSCLSPASILSRP